MNGARPLSEPMLENLLILGLNALNDFHFFIVSYTAFSINHNYQIQFFVSCVPRHPVIVGGSYTSGTFVPWYESTDTLITLCSLIIRWKLVVASSDCYVCILFSCVVSNKAFSSSSSSSSSDDTSLPTDAEYLPSMSAFIKDRLKTSLYCITL